MRPHTDLKTQSNKQVSAKSILNDVYRDKKQSGGKSKTRKTSQRKQLLNRIWKKKLSEIIVCAGTSSRFTNRVKPNQEVAGLWMGEREQPPSFHLVVNHKPEKEPAFLANTDLGKTQGGTMRNPAGGHRSCMLPTTSLYSGQMPKRHSSSFLNMGLPPSNLISWVSLTPPK